MRGPAGVPEGTTEQPGQDPSDGWYFTFHTTTAPLCAAVAQIRKAAGCESDRNVICVKMILDKFLSNFTDSIFFTNRMLEDYVRNTNGDRKLDYCATNRPTYI